VSWAEAVGLAAAANDDDGGKDGEEKDKSNRVKYTCPQCAANAWGRPDLALVCGKCRLDFVKL
jgi:ribosomal protein L37AE/L43A